MKIDLKIRYVYITNSDLKMSKGKIASQVSHCAMLLSQHTQVIGSAIILKAPETTLRKIMKIIPGSVEFIRDAGLTQVQKGSLTCIAYRETPYTAKKLFNLIGTPEDKLKLL